MSDPIRILAIDGGGIRGVIPAMVLAEIERLTQRPAASMFDLIAGTSTGGILALALSVPGEDGGPRYPARELIGLYETEGSRIFRRSRWHWLRSVASITEEKYPARGIEEVLERYFGETRLKDALTDVVVTSYETERRFPFFFKSRNARTKPGYDFPMKLVARAISAAPTYFEPLKLPAEEPAGYYSLIDGGVYANNPAMCGFAEAKATRPEHNDFLLVSLGTGTLTQRLAYDKIRGWGLAQWARPILNVVFDGVSGTVDYQLQQLLAAASSGAQHYWRFQVTLDEETNRMDDASPENIRALKLFAEKLLRERRKDIESLCEILENM